MVQQTNFAYQLFSLFLFKTKFAQTITIVEQLSVLDMAKKFFIFSLEGITSLQTTSIFFLHIQIEFICYLQILFVISHVKHNNSKNCANQFLNLYIINLFEFSYFRLNELLKY